VQETTAKDNGWVLGDTLTLTGATGTTKVEIGGVINSVGLGMPVIVNLDTLHDLVPSDQVQLANVMLTLAPGANPDQVRAEIVEIAKPYLVLSVFDQDEFRSQLTGQVNQMLAVIYALLGLTVAIAILGIVNTLGLGILERTREIGLLRAIGLSGSQLHSTITLESVLIASFGTLVGLGLGVGVTLGIPTLFKDMGFTELVIPWQSLGVMVVLALVVGVLAAIWPAIRANRIPVLTAISSDE
jgi:putative ABC transport system permease protein